MKRGLKPLKKQKSRKMNGMEESGNERKTESGGKTWNT